MIRSYCYKSSNNFISFFIMTPAEYKELIKKDTIKIGQDVEMTEYSDETKELIDELVADGNDYDVLEDFIKEHGESQFIDYIEEYLQAVDELSLIHN